MNTFFLLLVAGLAIVCVNDAVRSYATRHHLHTIIYMVFTLFLIIVALRLLSEALK